MFPDPTIKQFDYLSMLFFFDDVLIVLPLTYIFISYICNVLVSLSRSPSNGQVSGVLKEHNGTIRTVKFLGGGSGSEHAGSLLFASAGGGDCATRVWDAQSGKLSYRCYFV